MLILTVASNFWWAFLSFRLHLQQLATVLNGKVEPQAVVVCSQQPRHRCELHNKGSGQEGKDLFLGHWGTLPTTARISSFFMRWWMTSAICLRFCTTLPTGQLYGVVPAAGRQLNECGQSLHKSILAHWTARIEHQLNTKESPDCESCRTCERLEAYQLCPMVRKLQQRTTVL